MKVNWGVMFNKLKQTKWKTPFLCEWSFQLYFLPGFLRVGFLQQNHGTSWFESIGAEEGRRIVGGKLLAGKKLFMLPIRCLTRQNPEPAACPRSLGLRIQRYLAKHRATFGLNFGQLLGQQQRPIWAKFGLHPFLLLGASCSLFNPNFLPQILVIIIIIKRL